MKKLLLSNIFFAIVLCSNAQISLIQNAAPKAGMEFYYHNAKTPSPEFTFSKTGTNNTWDFTKLKANSADEDTTFYVAPADALGGEYFPDADVAKLEINDEDITPFIKTDPTGSYISGIVTMGFIFPYNTPQKTIPFPYTLNSTADLTSTLNIKLEGSDIDWPIDSVWLSRTIIVNKKVVASGNLILPSGNFPALLEFSKTTMIDSVFIKDAALTSNQWTLDPDYPDRTINSAYNWYTAKSLQPYAYVLYDEDGMHDVHYLRAVKNDAIAGIQTASTNFVQEFYPNPAKDFVKINTSKSLKEVSVMNLNGTEVLNQTSGDNTVNVADLAPGMYCIKITTTDNFVQSIKFIKM